MRAGRLGVRLTVIGIAVLFLAAGCGYTRETTLPDNIRSIHVDTVLNKIPIEEVYAYQPGVEIRITDAIIRRLQQDGNLRVVSREDADAILQSSLVGFEQEGLRFTSLESVEEFRLYIVLAVKLVNAKTGDVIWEEPHFSGDAEYFVSDVRSIGRGEATEQAVLRLARSLVDRIVEDW